MTKKSNGERAREKCKECREKKSHKTFLCLATTPHITNSIEGKISENKETERESQHMQNEEWRMVLIFRLYEVFYHQANIASHRIVIQCITRTPNGIHSKLRKLVVPKLNEGSETGNWCWLIHSESNRYFSFYSHICTRGSIPYSAIVVIIIVAMQLFSLTFSLS